MTRPSFEVLIVGYESTGTVADAVRSAALVPRASVAFVEHGGDDASLAVAAAAAAAASLDIRVTHDPSNPGFAAGVNGLARGSTADWLVLLNPDAVIEAWPWASNDTPEPPRSEVVGARQVRPDGRAIEAWGRTYGVLDEAKRSWLRRRPRPVEGRGFVGGGAMLVHRDTFQALGGLDERYFLFYEDIDFCFRAHAAGHRVRVEDEWVVRHALGSSTRRDWARALAASYESGRAFHAAHGHRVRGYDVYVTLDAAARALVWAVAGRRPRARAHLALARASARRARFRTEPAPTVRSTPS